VSGISLNKNPELRSYNSVQAALTAFLNEILNSPSNVEECSKSCLDWVIGNAALVAFLNDGLLQYG